MKQVVFLFCRWSSAFASFPWVVYFLLVCVHSFHILGDPALRFTSVEIGLFPSVLVQIFMCQLASNSDLYFLRGKAIIHCFCEDSDICLIDALSLFFNMIFFPVTYLFSCALLKFSVLCLIHRGHIHIVCIQTERAWACVRDPCP